MNYLNINYDTVVSKLLLVNPHGIHHQNKQFGTIYHSTHSLVLTEWGSAEPKGVGVEGARGGV